jgi:hypothetical protein
MIGVSTRMRMSALLFLLLLSGCADYFIVPANQKKLPEPHATRKLIDADARKVEVWIERSAAAQSSEPRALVLFFVGKADRIERWIDVVAVAWADYPVEIWGMNYPGSGGSSGPAHASLVAPDALAVFDAMKKEAGTRPIFVHAASLGTTAALCVVARRPVAGAVLQNPPPLRELILQMHGWWNLWLLATPVASHVPPELDSIENAKHARAPAIFIMADSDEVVPPRYQRMVVGAYVGPKREVHNPGARHDDPLTHEAAEEFKKDLNWLWKEALAHPVTMPSSG